jgi:hypothetical protein
VRFTWTKQYFTLADFGDTPGGAETTYLDVAAVQARDVPLQPETH